MKINEKLLQSDKQITIWEIETRDKIIKQYAIALKDIKKQIEYYAGKDILDYKQMAKYKRLQTLNDSILKILKTMYKYTNRDIKNMMMEAYGEAYLNTQWAISTDIGVNLVFPMVDNKIVKAAIEFPIDGLGYTKRATDRILKVNKDIQSELTQGLIQGKSYGKIIKAVTKKMNGAADWQANVVIPTEAHRISSMARLESGRISKERGVDIVKVWDATLDGSTRPAHQRLDGKKLELDKNFSSIYGGYGSGPGLMANAKDDINCRCVLRYEVKGISPKLRRARNKDTGKTELIKSMSYKKWEKYNKVKG